MSRRLTIVVLAFVSIGVVVFAWLLFSSPPSSDTATVVAPVQSDTHSTGGRAVPSVQTAEPNQAPTHLLDPGEDESPTARAQRLREALMVVAGGVGGGAAQPDAVAAGSERYVARLLEDVVAQVVGACYEQLLHSEPQAAGSIVLKLPLLGNESLGAVFVDVGFGSESTLTQSSFRACLSDRLMASVLEAPPGERSQLSITQVFDLEP